MNNNNKTLSQAMNENSNPLSEMIAESLDEDMRLCEMAEIGKVENLLCSLGAEMVEKFHIFTSEMIIRFRNAQNSHLR